MTQEIQNKQAFVVVNSNTMERISKFYSNQGLAKTFIKNRTDWNPNLDYSIAVFGYKEHYKMEENV